MKFFIFYIFIITSCFSALFANYKPLYSGPILAPGSTNMDHKKTNIFTNFNVHDNFGKIDSHWHHYKTEDILSINPTVDIQYGLFKYMDVTGSCQFFYNKKGHKKTIKFGDVGIKIGFPILTQEKNGINMRLTIKENFPSGKYKNLSPNKGGIDGVGSGTFQTFFGLNFSKIYYKIKNHPIRFHWSFNYSLETKAKVSGFHTYGGGFNTKGKVNPGNIFTTIFAFEFSLNRNWVYATDLAYTHVSKTTFSGTDGTDKKGNPAVNNNPSVDQFSLTQAIEYNFSEDVSIITGVWFSLAGRNSNDFINYSFGFNYTF